MPIRTRRQRKRPTLGAVGWVLMVLCGLGLVLGCTSTDEASDTSGGKVDINEGDTEPARKSGEQHRLQQRSAESQDIDLQRIEATSLPNLIRISELAYCGGQPEGSAGFQFLSELGVRTVVCVDGAEPNLVDAKSFGIRTIHIPMGYAETDREVILALARVAREIEGPIYFHCHHGKHRAPVAAALAALAGGNLDPDSAKNLLQFAGTDPAYAGLWKTIENYQTPAPDDNFPEFVERAEVSSLTATMARLDELIDALEASRKRTWQDSGSGKTAAQAALEMREIFHELNRQSSRDEQFSELLRTSESSAAEIERALPAEDFEKADSSLTALRATCVACHQQYRD